MNTSQKRLRNRLVVALFLFFIICALEYSGILENIFGDASLYAEFVLFLLPYLISGYDVLINAVKGVMHGDRLNEDFLMTIATIGAFALVLFPDSEPHMAEGAAVMLFFQVGELFQSYAVNKSRKSIQSLMEIAPEYANIMRDSKLTRVNPSLVKTGEIIIVKPGERIPLDGVVEEGSSSVDTAALTGEPIPANVQAGSDLISGCVNLTGTLKVRVSKPFQDSTVSRILELVENASEKKARTENFITRFATYYTPTVVGLAAAIALIPSLITGAWSDWILRGLTFLVVSCPCALVISIPLSFFGGIGGASKQGILVKGSNYLEILANVNTVVFDKTGTLTSGKFEVTRIVPAGSTIAPDTTAASSSKSPSVASTPTSEELLELAAYGEAHSNHPIALSVLGAYQKHCGKTPDLGRIQNPHEVAGQGVSIELDGKQVLVGNAKLLQSQDVDCIQENFTGTVLYVAFDKRFMGSIYVEDILKPDAREAISKLHTAGVKRSIMLTGDRSDCAQKVAGELGIKEFHAELLPADKVEKIEELLGSLDGAKSDKSASGNTNTNTGANGSLSADANTNANANTKRKNYLAFVGDGINDAPVLMRADVGIAMGALGSDAAIEAADVVLMDDKPSKIALAIQIARKTMGIVWQNIIFALGIKFAVLILAALGIANMWMAVFADVGVAILAILNAMRAMLTK